MAVLREQKEKPILSGVFKVSTPQGSESGWAVYFEDVSPFNKAHSRTKKKRMEEDK